MEITGDKVRLGILLFKLRRRSFGGLLFFLAILSLIPGVSIFSGILIAVLGGQLSIGLRAPLLPRKISEYNINVTHLKMILDTTVPKIEWVERYIQPRFTRLSKAPFSLMLGVLILALAVVSIIPLPFTNFLPAIAVLIISLGLLERDGLLILVGVAFSAVAIIIGATVIYLTTKGIGNIL